jgi:transcriptional regulator
MLEVQLGRLFTKPLQGALNLLILKALRRGPMHGYGITELIQEASDEVLQIEEGSLYPALHKMEHEGWITSEWAVSDTNRRVRYYELTLKGERQLATEERDYHRVSAAIAKALKYV